MKIDQICLCYKTLQIWYNSPSVINWYFFI